MISITIFQAAWERILKLCRGHDISINKLCDMSGVTRSTANNTVSGRNNSAAVAANKKLCGGSGITIRDFFNPVLFLSLEKELK